MQNSKNIHELQKPIAKQLFDKITDEDWQTLLAALSEKRDWQQMWRLVQTAPVMWSMRMLLQAQGIVMDAGTGFGAGDVYTISSTHGRT